MKIVVGSDHAGFPMKAEVLAFLKESGHEVLDVGSFDPAPVDFPDIARKVAAAITTGEATVPPTSMASVAGKQEQREPCEVRHHKPCRHQVGHP